MSEQVSNDARVIPPRPAPRRPEGIPLRPVPHRPEGTPLRPVPQCPDGRAEDREPLWRDLVGEVLRRERRTQRRTIKDVADAARISLPYLSEIERGRKEASSEVLAAAAQALGLGLGDLLSRAHGELTGRTAGHRRPAAAPRRPQAGLCLAA
ncbi:helix-turn-helix domain-containing protein [Streptomyces sp. NPDC096012]|uniref:helix-turn-helix domain-containing protein n=1 Tax=Streptomyces sp. NPDC096012 TaxID=3155684 RepID=UPI00336A9D2F